MSFDWGTFLTLAEELGARSDDEASRRTAISRAYYAAFHAACDFAEVHHGFRSSGTGLDHDAVRAVLRNHSPTARAAELLDRLRRRRNEADYKARCATDPKTIQHALQQAHTILADLRRHSGPSPEA